MKTQSSKSSFRSLLKLISLLLTLTLVAAACGSDDAVTSVAAEAADVVDGEEEAESEEEEEAMEDEDVEEEAMEDEDVEEEAMEDEDVEEEEVVEEEAPAAEEAEVADDLVIVSMSPTATEMLFAIGAGEYVVAADDNSNFPAEAPTNPDLTNFPINVEGILSFEPTLVVASGEIEGLDAVGVETLVLPFAATFDDTYAQIEQLGAATGQVGEAAELVSQIQTDIAAIVEATESPDPALTYYHELDDTLFSSTSSTFVGQVYSLFGLENVADAADPDGESFGFPQLNAEFLVTADPDLIFLADTICCSQTAETVAARPGWEGLSAVTNGNVIELNDDIASRWGPRLVDYVQAISDAISTANIPVAN